MEHFHGPTPRAGAALHFHLIHAMAEAVFLLHRQPSVPATAYLALATAATTDTVPRAPTGPTIDG